MKTIANNKALWLAETKSIMEILLELGWRILKILKLSVIILRDYLKSERIYKCHHRDNLRIIEYEMRKEIL